MITKFTDLKIYKFNKFFHRCDPYKNRNKFPDKLYNNSFFQKLQLALKPSYGYWYRVSEFFRRFPDRNFVFAHIDQYRIKFDKFEEEPVNVLLSSLNQAIYVWIYLPKFLTDVYKYYPEFNMSFDEDELRYIDYWMTMPKIIEELLSELLIRDAPLVDRYVPEEVDRYTILHGYRTLSYDHAVINQYMNPLIKEKNRVEHKKCIIDDILKDDTFKKMINFWLFNRLKSNSNLNLNSIVDSSLNNFLVLDIILNKVNRYTLRFLEANLFSEIAVLPKHRQDAILAWEGSSSEERSLYFRITHSNINITEQNTFDKMTPEELQELEVMTTEINDMYKD